MPKDMSKETQRASSSTISENERIVFVSLERWDRPNSTRHGVPSEWVLMVRPQNSREAIPVKISVKAAAKLALILGTLVDPCISDHSDLI